MYSVKPTIKYATMPLMRILPRFSKRLIKTKIATDIITSSHYLGESITLFVLFYSTLRWNMYRDIRKKREEDDNTD